MQERRKALDLTQADLAHALHYATITIRKIEEGESRPSRELAEKLAATLGVPDGQRDNFIAFARGVDVFHPVNSIPAISTPLISRESELAEVCAQLLTPEVHLVTLVGPPGVGKTRLAIEAARRVTSAFPAGACFVPLVEVRSEDGVPAAIADRMQARLAPGQGALDALKVALRERRMLLVLDNFEHVLAAARAVSELLAAAPQLTVLATSRAPLLLRAERVFAVPPLGVPGQDVTRDRVDRVTRDSVARDLDALGRCPAVALFVQRAQAVKPTFRLSAANAVAVADLCNLLEGLPLAIELAAGRMRMFSAPVLARHMREDASARMTWLAGGVRDAAPHQRTLRATLAWSYDLLTPAQQRLFRAMGAFRGTFSLPALEAVSGAAPGSTDLFDDLAALFDHNLVKRFESGEDETRYVLLETLREFAQEKMREQADGSALRDRHAAYYAEWVNSIETREDPQVLDSIRGEMANLEAAFAWSHDRAEVRAGAATLAIAILQARNVLGFFADQADDVGDAYRWLSDAAEDPSFSAGLRLRAALALSAWAAEHDLSKARAWADRALRIAWEQEDSDGMLRALTQATAAELMHGEVTKALAVGHDMLALARATHDQHLEASALGVLGWVMLAARDYDGAVAAFEQCLAYWRSAGVDWQLSGGIARSLLHLGRAWQMKGDGQRAAEHLGESAARYRSAGDAHGAAWADVFLGFLALDAADPDGAAECFKSALRGFPRSKDSWIGIAAALAGLALRAQRADDGSRAALLAGAAAGVSRLARGYPRGMNERHELDLILDEARGWPAAAAASAAAAAAASAWAEGEALSPDDAIWRALSG